jgi:hypothetical protein
MITKLKRTKRIKKTKKLNVLIRFEFGSYFKNISKKYQKIFFFWYSGL